MSSCSTSSFDSAIIRRVCANVFTLETVSVRSFFRPRISRYPRFGSYFTLESERSGNFRLGFCFLRILWWTSSACPLIFSTVPRLMAPHLVSYRAAPLQGVLERVDHLGLLLRGEAEDLPQRDPDVRDVLLDVGALLLSLLDTAPV